MKRLTLTAVVLAILVPLGGCGQPPKAVRADRHGGDDYPKVVGFKGLVGDLSVGEEVVKPGPNPPMSVSVPVRLRRDRAQNVQYRFVFLDLTGAPTRDEFPWRFVVMQPRVQTRLQGEAVSPRAVDWRLEVREASTQVEFR